MVNQLISWVLLGALGFLWYWAGHQEIYVLVPDAYMFFTLVTIVVLLRKKA